MGQPARVMCALARSQAEAHGVCGRRWMYGPLARLRSSINKTKSPTPHHHSRSFLPPHPSLPLSVLHCSLKRRQAPPAGHGDADGGPELVAGAAQGTYINCSLSSQPSPPQHLLRLFTGKKGGSYKFRRENHEPETRCEMMQQGASEADMTWTWTNPNSPKGGSKSRLLAGFPWRIPFESTHILPGI